MITNNYKKQLFTLNTLIITNNDKQLSTQINDHR